MNTAPSLLNLQADFARWMLGERGLPLPEVVAGNGLAPAARLQIYQNIIFNNLTAALRTDYPAVLKLVGEDFFESAAARYIREYPSRSGNLQDFGAAFPKCLAAMPEAATLPYLGDVARLEWARQESYLAADAAPLDAAALASLPEDQHATLRLVLHPSLRLVESAHPIWDIWMFCQEAAPQRLNLSGEGQALMVWRDTRQLVMQPMAGGQREFVAALLGKKPLAVAHASAVTAESQFDLTACLHWLLQTGLITGYSTNGPTWVSP